MSDSIVIRGARQHNLRNLDLEIPRDRFVVITGLSGSGKSSLAFDTIYAEGQRRYVESLSAYARQFLEQMEKPDVDSIEGLSPAISIEQKTTTHSPRSTVGTMTEVYDYLRLLYATIGKPHCWQCGREISSQTVAQIAARIGELPARSKVDVLAPIVRGRKGEYKKELADLKKQGFLRVRVDGVMRDLGEDITLARTQNHDIEVLVDRIVLRAGIESRLVDSIGVALRLAEQSIIAAWTSPDGESGEENFSQRFACATCGVSFAELSPRTFSFNSPHGACPQCNGLGRVATFDPERLVVRPEATIEDGAIAGWNRRLADRYDWAQNAVLKEHRASASTPWQDLPEEVRRTMLLGSGDDKLSVTRSSAKTFAGIVAILTKRFKESESEWVRSELEPYMSEKPCDACGGKRLRREARSVLVGGLSIVDVVALPLDEAASFLEKLKLTKREQDISKLVLKEIVERLRFLLDVGLSYLTLERATASLSGGESQRIRLATQIGAGLTGVLYVLDEPSIGLHQRDNARLLASLRALTDRGNSVLVVEHDADTMRAADHLIDLGPGAARLGGQVVAQGSCDEVIAVEASLTGRFLAGKEKIDVPEIRRAGTGQNLVVRGARHHNLRGIDVAIPLGCLTCVTGVSGSGKSSLIIDTLYASLARRLNGASLDVGDHDAIDGIDAIDKVIDIDQTPIGRTPRSNPATYTGLFGDIRDLFAMTPEARMRGYSPGRFSFNVSGGRCETCSGGGMIRIEMHFLPDVYVLCDACGGRRYNRETLEVRYKGKNIADVLDMTVAEALEFLSPIPSARRKLETLASVGLDYVHLGQQATTLSGGEAQRIKLARELARRATGRTLYILDEPTTGLHFADVRRLIEVLGMLVDAGNTVVVIEHQLDVVKVADWVIDLGPEGGGGGGILVAAGTPEEVAACNESHTGRFLKSVLS
ncbi:MAG TPA: excinuclease ABC subunit UvrA [Candidatus Binatia bacterium]|jgi:excinuclease ABC subunit A